MKNISSTNSQKKYAVIKTLMAINYIFTTFDHNHFIGVLFFE